MATKNKKIPPIGIDIVDISRFYFLKRKKQQTHIVKKFFSDQEIKYCTEFKDSVVHFAGIFAAKEAASKALGTEKFPFIELEIRHAKNGAPELWKNNKKLRVQISISHTDSVAVAVAIA